MSDKWRCYQCGNIFEDEPADNDHANDITCSSCGWTKQAYKFDNAHDEKCYVMGDRIDELLKAEAKLRRIEQVAIHTTQGNCIIPSSLVLGGES